MVTLEMSEELTKPISLVLVLVRAKRPCFFLFYKKSLSSDFVAMETQKLLRVLTEKWLPY